VYDIKGRIDEVFKRRIGQDWVAQTSITFKYQLKLVILSV
jgi:hypothetical protein